MAFGDTLAKLYNQASETSQAAFNAAAKTTSDAIAGLERAAAYTKDKANEAYGYGKEKARQVYDYGNQKATQAKDYAVEKYNEGKNAVGQQVTAAKLAVDKKLNPQPAGAAIEPCPNQNKAERVKARQQKINDSKEKLKTLPSGQNKEALAQSTARLERNNYAVERARLAQDTYNVGQTAPPEGWERVSKAEMEQLGINASAFPQNTPRFNPEKYKEGGFYAELYKSKPEVFGEEKYVLGLRGTIPSSTEDWIQGNLKQGIGMESDYYEQAKNISRNLKSALGDNKLEVTGHSLGGGMATAASIVAGVPGFSFDTAGVHPGTLESAGAFSREQANQLMQNFHTQGEILNTVQNPTLQRSLLAAGIYAGGAPAAIGMAAGAGRTIIDNGTLSYGAAGPMYEVPALANAHEVALAAAKGEGIQGISPGLVERLNNQANPLKKVDLHDMDYAIAGMEQQKADDLAVIDRS